MSSKNRDNREQNSADPTSAKGSSAKPLRAADLKSITGGFVPNEQAVKIPSVPTIKVKLRDADLTSDGDEKN
jgi:hypothetical protein